MTRADLLLIVVLAAAVGWLAAAQWVPRGAAAMVEIRSGHELVGQYPLADDADLEITGRIGLSQIRIRDARARFIDGPCRGKVCVHSGWLSASGEAAACAPNGVSLRLTGHRAEYDALGR